MLLLCLTGGCLRKQYNWQIHTHVVWDDKSRIVLDKFVVDFVYVVNNGWFPCLITIVSPYLQPAEILQSQARQRQGCPNHQWEHAAEAQDISTKGLEWFLDRSWKEKQKKHVNYTPRSTNSNIAAWTMDHFFRCIFLIEKSAMLSTIFLQGIKDMEDR